MFCRLLQIQSETQSFIRHHSGESAAAESADTAAGKQETWQCLDDKDGTLTNAGRSDIYNRHRISDSGSVSQHTMPWYPYEQLDAFGTLNAAFGMKAEETENPIHMTVKTELKSEPVDCRMESGDSSGHWQAEPFCSTVNGSDSAHAEFDLRPLRVVASVAPTLFESSSAAELPVDSRGLPSDADISLSHFPPPLVPLPSSPSATGCVLTPGLPFSGHMFNSSSLEAHSLRPASPRELKSPAGPDDVTESDPEPDDGHCSPPPERVNQEAHHSRNAM